MKRYTLFGMALAAALSVQSQSLKFDFSGNKKVKAGYTKVETTDRFSEEKGYGYDLQASPEKSGCGTFYFSVAVPDGNYRVVATVGGKSAAGETTVRGESRRLFFENVATRKGETKRCEFVINKRNTHISDTEDVRIKPRERSKLNWDDKLTIEINGDAPLLTELTIERDDRVPTIFLCGNSTVVDQDNEPWASWGQMVTRFLTDSVSVANYAESGERADTFIAAGRLKKLLTQMKPGDYIFMEFGHNDQKLKGAGKGAYYSFATCLKTFLDEARAKGANPVFVTPTQRRSFNDEGKIVDTHEDYPEAMRWVADRECVPVIELNEMTRTLYEAMGVEGSKRAFVHYPAGSYPGQDKPFADNTHFNPYGAYEIAKCILIGLQQNNIPLRQYIRADFGGFNPAQPDDRDAFKWNDSPFTEIEKPDGN